MCQSGGGGGEQTNVYPNLKAGLSHKANVLHGKSQLTHSHVATTFAFSDNNKCLPPLQGFLIEKSESLAIGIRTSLSGLVLSDE